MANARKAVALWCLCVTAICAVTTDVGGEEYQSEEGSPVGYLQEPPGCPGYGMYASHAETVYDVVIVTRYWGDLEIGVERTLSRYFDVRLTESTLPEHQAVTTNEGGEVMLPRLPNRPVMMVFSIPEHLEDLITLITALKDQMTDEDREELARRRAASRGPALVVGHRDIHLSKVRTEILAIQALDYFDSITYEAMDVDMDGVTPHAMGLSAPYIPRCGEKNIMNAIESANVANKSNSILGAWGKMWPQLDSMRDRKSAKEFVEAHEWVDHGLVSTEAWWAHLGTYRFIISPTGFGIQSPKTWEAILMQTIPIVLANPTYSGLKDMGFPIVVVHDWNEITEPKLDEWWAELSPKLPLARWMFNPTVWAKYFTAPVMNRPPDIMDYLQNDVFCLHSFGAVEVEQLDRRSRVGV